MPHLAVPGAELYFETDGRTQAPAVFMLPAGIASLRMWDRQVGALAEEHLVVRFDPRGIGGTRADESAFSHRDDVRAVLDHLGIARATLVGASFGGSIAIDVALETPDRVAGVVAVGSGPSGFPAVDLTPEEDRRIAELDDAEEARDWDRLVELETKLWAAGPRRALGNLDPYFVQEAFALNRANLPHLDRDAAAVPLSPPAYGRLGELDRPALVMVGAYDLGPAIMQYRYLVEQLPHVTGFVFDDAAHLPNLERAAEFDRVLGTWLGEAAL